MVFRERHFVFLSLFICVFVSVFLYLLRIPLCQIVIPIVFFIGLILGLTLYDYTFLEKESTSYYYAGKKALEYGYNPVAQDGRIYDPEKYTLTQLFNKFPNNRHKIPLQNSAGFMFTTYCHGKKSNKVEFYVYENSTLYYYKFYFSDSDTFDYVKYKQMNKIPKNKIFVSLEIIK